MSRTDQDTGQPHGPPHARYEALLAPSIADICSTRDIDRYAKAHDASHYLLIPEAVITPRDVGEAAAVLRACHQVGLPLTFRSGGTSLSGQAQSDQVLVDTRRHFRGIEVLDDGARVRVQPGATVRQVNAALAPHGRKLGPDPASEGACTMGGVIANNSSGMACGTEFNTYRTIESAVIVLHDGMIIDTGAPDADQRLATQAPVLHEGLLRLRDRVRGNTDSVRILRRAFALKNTMGYGLNSFLDFNVPSELLLHLLVGSEGTLGFVAEATFRTVPVRPHAASGLLVFDDLDRAVRTLPALVELGFATIELLDATSLRVSQRDPRAQALLGGLPVVQHAALLVEHQEVDVASLDERVAQSAKLLRELPLIASGALTRDPALRADLWHLRKGLYAAVAGDRPAGTTALLEDIAVPVSSLADVCSSLNELFTRYAYADAVVFGHAKDGNIHFLLSENFGDDAGHDRYLSFTDAMVDLVLEHHGTLKAEHGTGRIMAPYVERQYGTELYSVTKAVKELFDPRQVLNPEVIVTTDPMTHVSHLKTNPAVEEEVDRCVECGFCEPVCPSRDLTLTPRERIVLRREIRRAEDAADWQLAASLTHDYDYDGLQTCAVDGMCQTACPVFINTGSLVRRLRAETRSTGADRIWGAAARHWSAATKTSAAALTAASRVPDQWVTGPARLARKALGNDNVPLWTSDLPSGGDRRSLLLHRTSDAEAVHFPACVGALFGSDHGGASAALHALTARSGLPSLRIPPNVDLLCCGTPWKSKGLASGYAHMQETTLASLWTATEGGLLPVICDASSCTEGLQELASRDPQGRQLRFVDALSYTRERILPRLHVDEPLDTVMVHPTCATRRLGLDHDLLAIASAAATRVQVPASWGCCAFAGDRGMLHPALTASATAAQAAEIAARPACDAYVSSNRTCEIGMTRATGKPYRHVLELVAALTAPSHPPIPDMNRTEP